MDVCTVCCEEVKKGEDGSLSLPGCGHTFHVRCALSFCQFDVRCPTCRAVPEGVTEKERKEGVIVIHFEGEEVGGDVEMLEEEGEEWREIQRFKARRRKVLKENPVLQAKWKEIQEMRRGVVRKGNETNSEYEKACKRVWKEDESVNQLKEEYTRMRKCLARRRRTLKGKLMGLMDERDWAHL